MTVNNERNTFISTEELPHIVATLCRKVKRLERNISKGRTNGKSRASCGTTLNKSELAQLFFILMDEDILIFDEHDKNRNRGMLQCFIERHFTYRGDKGLQTPISKISKEFSEAKGFTYREKHMLFLDKMISLLQQRKQRR
ncbi:hypothetical protein ACHRV5_11135 [Flavobacterium sp. FlaQc-52]|uniref:hypothetical protein n=1 Tax=Flavobacterium sp. FlaQc-52 TaxID=3374185 RepID=UPI003756AE69